MFAVVFEVQPKKERWEDYLGHAKALKPLLEKIDGFIDNERFESKRTAGLLLSLSTWRDEKSVVRWRTQGDHHGAQGRGRFEIFQDYHLRVGEITGDTHPPMGLEVIEKRFDETETGRAKMLTISELTPKHGKTDDPAMGLKQIGLNQNAAGLLDSDLFESITSPGKLVALASWKDAEAASRFTPRAFGNATDLRHRHIRVIRDYGMFDRHEAPQYYAKVDRKQPRAAE